MCVRSADITAPRLHFAPGRESNVYSRDGMPVVSRIVQASAAFATATSVARWKSQIRPLISA